MVQILDAGEKPLAASSINMSIATADKLRPTPKALKVLRQFKGFFHDAFGMRKIMKITTFYLTEKDERTHLRFVATNEGLLGPRTCSSLQNRHLSESF